MAAAFLMLNAHLMVPIVIIDDSREDLLLAERVIRQARLCNPVHQFRDAAQSHSYFSDESAGATPVLMFIDLLMFPQSGIELLRSLKRHERVRASLAVMLTGLGDVRYIQRGYDAGATTFLIKPLAVDDFRNFLKAFHTYFHIQDSSEGKILSWSEIFLRRSRPADAAADDYQKQRCDTTIPKPLQ